MQKATRCVLAAAFLVVSSGTPSSPAPWGSRQPKLPGTIVDLTHAFDADTIYWPTAGRFELESVAHGVTDKGYFYAANRFSAAEHGGTHLDAPIHFSEKGKAADAIPVEQLIGVGIRVDVSETCAKDRDYRVSVADLTAWEIRNGRIPGGRHRAAADGLGRALERSHGLSRHRADGGCGRAGAALPGPAPGSRALAHGVALDQGRRASTRPASTSDSRRSSRAT